MNYQSMPLGKLAKLLEERGLGNIQLRNQLNTFYGVPYMPQQQKDAREEAIKQLEAYDRNKLSTKKLLNIFAIVIGVLAGIATITGTLVALTSGHS